MNKHGVAFLFVLLCISVLVVQVAIAERAVSFTIARISAKDKKAVVRLADGTMKLLSQGELVPTGRESPRLRVTEIAQDRIVLEEETGQAKDRVVVRLVNGKQTVEWISKVAKQGAVSSSLAIGRSLSRDAR